jgi:hypothetical protein
MRIKPRQLRAIDAPLRGRSLDRAAAEAGVAPMTLRRWRRDPAFQAAYRDAVRRPLIGLLRFHGALRRIATMAV